MNIQQLHYTATDKMKLSTELIQYILDISDPKTWTWPHKYELQLDRSTEGRHPVVDESTKIFSLNERVHEDRCWCRNL